MATKSLHYTPAPRNSPIGDKLAALSIPEPNSGCFLWLGAVNAKGAHGRMEVAGRMVFAHRVAWEAANGPIPEGLCVLHKCDVPSCINPEHLFLGTQAANMQDKINKGRAIYQRGEGHHQARLSVDQVIAIRRDTRRQRIIADDYGVTRGLVSAIKIRRAWRHI